MIVTFKLPRIPANAVSNLAGLLGLIAVAVAIGGLTGVWWWSVLAGGVFAVGLAVMAGLGAEAGQQSKAGPRPVAARAS